MNLLKYTLFLLIVVIKLALALQKGRAVFNTSSGISGTMRIIPTLGYGTYILGQIRNINCANLTSGANQTVDASKNSCILGVTINNLNLNSSQNYTEPQLSISQIVNGSSLPDLIALLNNSRFGVNGTKEVFSTSTPTTIFNNPTPTTVFNNPTPTTGFNNPTPTTVFNNPTPTTGFNSPTSTTGFSNPTSTTGFNNPTSTKGFNNPILTTVLNNTMVSKLVGNCENIGDVYNPIQNITAGIQGIPPPKGIIGNILVTGGAGNLILGPLDMSLVGPTSVIGLPFVIWKDAIQPNSSLTTSMLNGNSRDRMLGCALILPLNGSFGLI